ncbi:MAG: chloride channel protein [Candidatus Marinimicrobia bacterium]|nr:chloride channel protein [Candidatus Neomarinimicrobiota bacterium]
MQTLLRRVLESSVLFIHVVRWFFIATLVGVVVGAAATVFLLALDGSISWTQQVRWYWLLLPAAFAVSTWLVHRFAPDAEGHGTEKVIEAVHRKSGRIRFLVVPVKAVATIITIALGGAAGKEGPVAQIGAGLASKLADILRFRDKERKKIVMCGISAGFAVVFGTPIAGAIFGVEVLFVGAIVYDVLFPSFVAGIVAYATAHWMGISYPHQFQQFELGIEPLLMVKVIVAGIFFGLLALMFIESMSVARRLARKITLSPVLKALLGGAILVGLAAVMGRQYLGLGIHEANEVVRGGSASPAAPFIKMLFTSITLNFGGSGGTLSPIFYIGATGGHLFARLLSLDPAFMAAIGMVALLAGATNTPISASIMAVELFGPQIVPYAALASIVAYLMSGHRSIYPSQILAMIKSPALRMTTGKQFQDMTEPVHFSSVEADQASSLLIRGSATAMRRIKASIRRRRQLPAKVERESKSK